MFTTCEFGLHVSRHKFEITRLINQRVSSRVEILRGLGPDEPIDMVKHFFFFFLALDVITGLSFGQSFDCLQAGRYHPGLIYSSIRFEN